MSKIVIKDSSRTKELIRNMKKLDKSEIKIGVLGADSDLAMIAAVHEYGVEIDVTDKMRGWFTYNGYPLKASTTKIVIPERSYLRSGFDENVDEITSSVKKLLPDILENNTNSDEFMDMIGSEFAGLIQKKIKNLSSPANSSMTIERKGSANPLIDSGRLVGAIRHEVD